MNAGLKELRKDAFRLTAAGVTAVCLPVLVQPPTARADDPVTYEVVSDTVAVADIEYQTNTGRVSAGAVTLPWRMDTMVQTVDGPPPHGSQLRADWRPSAAPQRWVSVRVIHRGKVICQNTLDIGAAACYGVTRRIT